MPASGKTSITVDDGTLELLRLASFQIQARENKRLTMNDVILRLLHAANKPSATQDEIETAAAIGAEAVVTGNQERR